MIPGSNLLEMALSVIASQTVLYYAATGRSVNDVGQDVTTYADATMVSGSFQPVPRALYEAYGLDFQRTYYTLYSSTDIVDLERDVSGDQIEFNGKRFQCQSANDWFAVDGWKGILCVVIDNAG